MTGGLALARGVATASRIASPAARPRQAAPSRSLIRPRIPLNHAGFGQKPLLADWLGDDGTRRVLKPSREASAGQKMVVGVSVEKPGELRPATRFRAVRYAELSVDVREVEFDRRLGDPEQLRDL